MTHDEIRNETGPGWLDCAREYIGVREVPGQLHSEIIVSWWETMKAPFRNDETPWCAAFVGAVLEECGIKSTRSPAARSYLKHGKAIVRPAVGSIVVFWRGNRQGWSGHVGFIVGKDEDGNLMVLGGNQGNAVSVKPFSVDRVLGYRWPGKWPYPWRYKLPTVSSSGLLSVNEV